ncbi:conserved protein of unknown function precursor containing a type A C-terminal secretion signal [Tenacibaculum sp. 190524A02b]|uniref:T9SS type A sorting domain-containing protein n=1 Tax=Tenacibaculum vairaonense TaxID=3137860 RepID=UPI0032B239A5
MLNKLKFLTLLLIILGVSTSLNSQTNPKQIDPGLYGNFKVDNFDYEFGTTKLPSLPNSNKYDIRIRANARFPRGNGSFPLVVIMHGKHHTCYVTGNSKSFPIFPCDGPNSSSLGNSQEIPNHAGYDYLLDFLASHGYIAISVDTNDILTATYIERPDFSNTFRDESMKARAELLQQHLDIWKKINDTPGQFNNKIDFNNIVTVGHSRGGEGVVSHFIHNAKQKHPYNIKGVFAVAPTNYNNFSHPDMNYAVILPYCDGDLTDLPGLWNYDRQTEISNKPVHQILLKGANHNYFNTVWTPNLFPAGTTDDWEHFTKDSKEKGAFCGNDKNRFSASKQRNVLKAYLHSFLKKYINNDNQYSEPILGTNKSAPKSTQLGNNEVHISYQAPKHEKVLIHRVKDSQNSFNTSSGGRISHNELKLKVCANGCLSEGLDDHKSNFNQGLPRIIASWQNTKQAWLELSIPWRLRNISRYTHLTFRAGYTAQPPWKINNNGPNEFTIRITDTNGRTSETTVNKFSSALYAPPGTFGTVTPHNIANTVAIPMSAFKNIDPRNITSIRFIFNHSISGEVHFTDVAFANYSNRSNRNFKETANTNDYNISDRLDLNIFPNPAKDLVNVNHNSTIENVSIVNLNGQILYKNEFKNSQNKQSIPVNNLARGVYLIVINNKHHRKLVLN